MLLVHYHIYLIYFTINIIYKITSQYDDKLRNKYYLLLIS